MGSRYVRPETTLLHISQGDTLTVKKRLTHGERSASYARQYEPGPDGMLVLKPAQIKLSMVTAYLIDWSLVDLRGDRVEVLGQPLEVVEAALNGLSPEDFEEIHAAIEKHEKAMRAERAREKKLTASSNGAEVTSGSRSAVDGPSPSSVS